MSDDFREVKNRSTDKRKTKKRIICRSDRINRLGGVAKKAVVCINRLDPCTTTQAVSEFLKAKGATVRSCFKIILKHSAAAI